MTIKNVGYEEGQRWRYYTL